MRGLKSATIVCIKRDVHMSLKSHGVSVPGMKEPTL